VNQEGENDLPIPDRRRSRNYHTGTGTVMKYPERYTPEQYRKELLDAIQGIDLSGVNEAIGIFRDARAHGRCIFVCGSGSSSSAASHLLCEMVAGTNINRSAQFRILEVSDELSTVHGKVADQVFLEQLKNIAEHGDVLVGISTSGNCSSILRAFEYAGRIGCRTISITGRDGGNLASLSDLSILVPASHAGSVEDAHMILCRMIGYYFVNFDRG
jgi:D-sedoheptulose 7-phosphate isomerase